MVQTVPVIYENGVFKPLQKIHIRDHQRFVLKLDIRKKSVSLETQSMIKADPNTVKEVAEEDTYLYNS